MRLIFIALLACSQPSGRQTASVLRFFNPYSWFSSGMSLRPLVSPQTGINDSVLSGLNQTSFPHEDILSDLLVTKSPITVNNSATTERPLTVLTSEISSQSLIPLSVSTVDLQDRGARAGAVHALVPTNMDSLSGSRVDIRRFGLLREKDIPEAREGREEIELQTTTGTIESDLPATTTRTSEANFTSDERQEENALSSSTEGPEPALTTSSAATPVPISPAGHQDERPPQTLVHTTTASSAKENPIPSPGSGTGVEAPFMTFLYTDDFARYLNRNYYTRPVFDGVVGRQRG